MTEANENNTNNQHNDRSGAPFNTPPNLNTGENSSRDDYDPPTQQFDRYNNSNSTATQNEYSRNNNNLTEDSTHAYSRAENSINQQHNNYDHDNNYSHSNPSHPEEYNRGLDFHKQYTAGEQKTQNYSHPYATNQNHGNSEDYYNSGDQTQIYPDNTRQQSFNPSAQEEFEHQQTYYLTHPNNAKDYNSTPKNKSKLMAGAAIATSLLALVLGGTALAKQNNNANNTSSSDNISTTTSNGTQTQPKIVQGGNNINWNATANVASPSVVTIQVQGDSGSGEGSGVIYDTSGHIITNNHVVSVAGTSGQIQVNIGNKAYKASIVGTDSASDLAVIKIAPAAAKLSPIVFANSSQVLVGDQVMAVGSPLGLSDTATTGIVSALQRPVVTQSETSNDYVVTNAIQTSAPINPGNSGGALVNKNGALVGINSSIATLSGSSSGQSSSESGSIGIGFAIPSNYVRNIAEQILKTGTAKHAYLGITPQATSISQADNSATLGVKIINTTSNSPASKAGLSTGDTIVSFNGHNTTTSEELIALVRELNPGDKAKITYLNSNKETKTTTVTLGSTS